MEHMLFAPIFQNRSLIGRDWLRLKIFDPVWSATEFGGVKWPVGQGLSHSRVVNSSTPNTAMGTISDGGDIGSVDGVRLLDIPDTVDNGWMGGHISTAEIGNQHGLNIFAQSLNMIILGNFL